MRGIGRYGILLCDRVGLSCQVAEEMGWATRLTVRKQKEKEKGKFVSRVKFMQKFYVVYGPDRALLHFQLKDQIIFEER
jgi:hypothetical protein